MPNPLTMMILNRTHTAPRRRSMLAFCLGIAAALTIHATAAKVSLHRTLDADPYSWASTNEMTSARSYAQQGILALHGLQIVNNPPLGAHPDAYTHWPPLFPMLLSRAFLVVGDSDATARTFAIIGSLTLAVSFVWMVFSFFGLEIAAVSTLALLTLPAFAVFSRLILGVNFSLACMVVALVCFVRATESPSRKWAILGCCAFGVGALLRWEPLMLAPALLLEGLVARNRTRAKLAVLYCVVGTLVVLGVLGGYLLAAPWLASDVWHTALYRAGIEVFSGAAVTLNELPYRLYFSAHPMPPLWPWLREAAFRFVNGPGLLGLLATTATVAYLIRCWSWKETERLRVVIAGLAGAWLLWWVVMRNQVFDNGFEIMIAAPAVALCLGLAADFLAFDLLTTRLAPWALTLVLLIPLWQYLQDVHAETANASGIAYSHDIERLTPTDAIVLVPYDGMETVYYSRRHVVRSISNDAAVEEALSRAQKDYPGAPVFLAVPQLPEVRKAFVSSIAACPVAAMTEHLSLLLCHTRSRLSHSSRNDFLSNPKEPRER